MATTSRGDEIRSRILQVVKQRPGISLSELKDIIRLPRQDIHYHTGYMERGGLIKKIADGRLIRLLVSGDYDDALERNIIRFAHPLANRIGNLLLVCPMSAAQILRTLRINEKRLRIRLNGMLRRGEILKDGGHGGLYLLANPELARKAIEATKWISLHKPGQAS